MLTKSDTGESEWVDPDDAPPLTEAFFERARWERNGVPIPTPTRRERHATEPPMVETRLRVDEDVLEYFKSSGEDWRVRINAALRRVMEAGG